MQNVLCSKLDAGGFLAILFLKLLIPNSPNTK